MALTDEQKIQVASWISEGAGLSEVQKRLNEEFQVNMTFMEVRFLVDDLDLELKDKAPKPEADLSKAPPPPEPGLDSEPTPFPGAGEAPGGDGKVRVTVDPVQRPGAMVSGEVTFSDGETMGWQLDQMGRLGLIPGKTEGYRPSEMDIAAFQTSLQAELQKKGY